MVEPAVRVEERATDSKIEDLLVVAIDIVAAQHVCEQSAQSQSHLCGGLRDPEAVVDLWLPAVPAHLQIDAAILQQLHWVSLPENVHLREDDTQPSIEQELGDEGLGQTTRAGWCNSWAGAAPC